MNKQQKQLVALVVLVVLSLISWRVNRIPQVQPSAIITKAAKAKQQDSLLKTRFHKVRSEMDGLYHYRIKPLPFDTSGNPFRISRAMAATDAGKTPQTTPDTSKGAPLEALQPSALPAEFGDSLLKHAVENIRLGGVVTMNDVTQLTVNGQLHKEGDVFTAKVKSRAVLIRIKHLSESFVTFALDDPDAGNAETRLHLK